MRGWAFVADRGNDEVSTKAPTAIGGFFTLMAALAPALAPADESDPLADAREAITVLPAPNPNSNVPLGGSMTRSHTSAVQHITAVPQ
ncbi:hypothetical protein I1A62_06020 (plasmid) [Rhodococcus sp. USK10]|uniref:hypothetical protein n=1 Tax=Rhodococcus sp. USK10 TaxID=2789739 RepID=UPI001C5FA0CC|nr:hypothetical protein [Rhodococcus sp. USK10]QYB00526.1 hypothetical protein I1A62_06020 [Rhodococcus sp. USK10]